MGVAFCISHGSVMWNTRALRSAEAVQSSGPRRAIATTNSVWARTTARHSRLSIPQTRTVQSSEPEATQPRAAHVATQLTGAV